MGRMKEERLKEEERLAKVAPELLEALKDIGVMSLYPPHGVAKGSPCDLRLAEIWKRASGAIKQGNYA